MTTRVGTTNPIMSIGLIRVQIVNMSILVGLFDIKFQEVRNGETHLQLEETGPEKKLSPNTENMSLTNLNYLS
jgi:hypothetical protein